MSTAHRRSPRDDHLLAIPPPNEEDAVADLAGGHRVEQEPPVQRGRVETTGGAQQRLVFQALRPAKALHDHHPEGEGLGGRISRAPVKSLFELGAEPFRGRTRVRRIVDRWLPLARSTILPTRVRPRNGSAPSSNSDLDQKSTRLNSSHVRISYAGFR